jgi:hypothetical protein
MYGNFFSIRKLRETGCAISLYYDDDSDLYDEPPARLFPYPIPGATLPARIDYDIPTYLRRGIKFTEPVEAVSNRDRTLVRATVAVENRSHRNGKPL